MNKEHSGTADPNGKTTFSQERASSATGIYPFLGNILLASIASAFLYFLSQFSFLFANIPGLFIPLPFLLFYPRIGSIGVISGLSLIAGFTLIISDSHGLYSFIIQYGIMTIVLAEVLKKAGSINRVIAKSTLLIVGMYLIISATFYVYTGNNPLKMVYGYLSETAQRFDEVFKSNPGMDKDTLAYIKDVMPRVIDAIIRLLPGMIIAMIILASLLNIILAKRILPSDQRFKDFHNLTGWSAPEPFVWILIIGSVMILTKVESLSTIGLNALIVVLFIYFLQGLSIISHFFKRKNIPAFLRGLGYAFIIVQQLPVILVIGLGLFDNWFDFRKLRNT